MCEWGKLMKCVSQVPQACAFLKKNQGALVVTSPIDIGIPISLLLELAMSFKNQIYISFLYTCFFSLLNNWHNSTLAMSMIGWKPWKRTFRTNTRGEWQGCCGCLWAKNLAWIQFMLDWITILSLGALLGPFVFFFWCDVVDLVPWIGQTWAFNAMFAQLYK